MMQMPKERLIDYIELVDKNFWTLQNNWIINMEARYGDEVALEFDDLAFGRCCEIQVYRLKKFFGLGDDIPALMKIFDFSQFCSTLDTEFHDITDKQVMWRVTRCPIQLARIERGESEIPCKVSAIPINEKIAKAINPKMKCTCIICPPDPHPADRWCEFKFTIED